MRLEVAGAQITESVVDVLDTLQNEPGVADEYIKAIDVLTRRTILDINAEDDAETFALLRALQMIRRDIVAMAMPPDVDDPGNDEARVSL